MNDYGGLGIVLEEIETENNSSNLSQQQQQQQQQQILSQKATSLTSSRQSSIVSLSKTISQRPSLSYTSPSATNDNLQDPLTNDHEDDDYDDDVEHLAPPPGVNSVATTTTESLLPPLPDALEDLTSPSATVTAYSTTTFDDMVSSSTSATDSDSNHSHINLGDIYSHSKSSFSNYALDSPNLLLDQSNLQMFPSLPKNGNLESTSTTSTIQPPASSSSASSSAPPSANDRTSPLKRLKNGIRKLSLGGSNNNSNNSSTCSTPTIPKFAPNATSSPANPTPLRPVLTPIQIVKPQQPSQSVSSSTSTNSSFSSKFDRARASSQGNNSLFTPVTPPVTSPVITLGEDLANSKNTLTKIEQSYFDSLHTSHAVTSVDELVSAEELLNYSHFLIQQRSVLDDVFQKTKERLQASGWCSAHDLNNLQLQQDTSRSQIDTSLLKIEERLNREFSCSVLGNTEYMIDVAKHKHQQHQQSNTHSKTLSGNDKNSTISPSLKVLESRCISFTNF
ncbi:hypothetical protein SBY92_004546 [Candida maltosa Xu316]